MTTGFRASVVLRDLPAALALARPPVIVVVVPGPVASAVEVSGARRVTARRGDRSAPRLLVGGDVLDLAGPLVLDELQWADDLSLETIAGLARDLLDARRSGGPMVAVWRSGADRPALSELLLMAAGAGSVIEVIPDTVESLVDAGFEPAKAIELIAATGGLPELVAAAARSTTVDHEVAARLDLLDAETRWAADLLAFGGAVAHGPGPALVVEGLVLPGAAARMPAAVARVVRAACPPDRRGSIAALVADHGDRCDRVALAGHLLALDDRSAVAVACYLEAAVEATGAAAVAFAGAARSGGGDEATCRRVAAGGLLDCSRPVEALRELAGLDEPEDHRTRGRAWSALGDPVAASVAFAAAGDEAWAEIAGIGAGIEPVRAIADDGSAAALAAVSLAAWSTGDFRRADEVIEPLTAATRRQRWLGGHREPVAIAELVVRVAERLGDHAAARATAADVDTMPEDTPHRPHLELVAGWIEARRGVLDHAGSDIVGESEVAPRWRLVREATRCAVAVRDTDGVGLDAATIAAAEAARAVAADLFDLDLRGDIAAAMERARADHLGDPLAPVAALAERGGQHHRFDVAWCRLQAALGGDRLDRIAERARELLALDPSHDRHRHAPLIRVLARSVAAPTAASPTEVIDGARRLAAAGAPHAAARWCGVIAVAASDETTARLLLRESRAWRASRTRLRRSSGSSDAIVSLSEQEERIGRLVLEGRTHKEIGAALFVSPKTVEHHVAHIRTKLGAASRADLLSALRDYLA